MQYGLRDIGDMLATPAGRWKLLYMSINLSWPLLALLAGIHRRTLARRTRIAAVVGSFGKSTTLRFVQAALSDEPDWLSPQRPHSFLALEVLKIRPGDKRRAFEVMISGPGWMEKYARMIRPDITVVTSIGSEHLSSFGTLDVTRSEKSRMVEVLPETGHAVLNGDDKNVLWMADKTRARVTTFGFGETNDVRASGVTLDWPRGMRFKIHAEGQTRDVRVRLIGRHMVYPVLAAAAAALGEGFTLDEVLARLEPLGPTPGRLEPLELPSGAFLLRDDYKSALETVEAALDVLSEVPARRKILVLGDVEEPPGSPRAVYREIGRQLAGVVSSVVFYDNSGKRGYSTGARRAGLDKESIFEAKGIFEAIDFLKSDLSPGDVVLIKGRVTQRLDRVSLALMGRSVGCDIKFCNLRLTRCASCTMLEQGWSGRRFVR